MARTSYFDVIVLGCDPAALMAAGLLRRQNYRVLLIGHGGPSAHYGEVGEELAAMPPSLPPYGHSAGLDRVFAELKLEDPVHQLGIGKQSERGLQVITPGDRIDLRADPEALAKELDRALPRDSAKLQEQIGQIREHAADLSRTLSDLPQLPPAGLRDRTRVKRLGRIFEPESSAAQWHWLLRILGHGTTFQSQLDLDNRASAITMYLMTAEIDGMREVPDFMGRLLSCVEKAGAEMELDIIAKELLIEGRAVIGLEAMRETRIYKCGCLVCGLPVDQLGELIPLKKRRRRLRAMAGSVRPSQSCFCVDLTLPSSALPMGMGRRLLLVQQPEEPLVEENLIQIRRAPHPQRKDRECVRLSCLVPYKKRSLGREYIAPLQNRMVQAASRLIPFLEENLEGMTSPFWDQRSNDAGHPSPWLLHHTIETDLPVVLGAAVLPPRLAYRNLMLCGAETLPGLGMEGRAQNALQVTQLIGESLKLKKII
ncbi:MAG: hypothetical protein JXR96_07855 [Deltaproteobacteria bacterium]|nr:hypothetical protein [Deltaproteobacteria bacterium]